MGKIGVATTGKRPKAPRVCLAGDGGSWSELEAAARMGLDLRLLMLNNHTLGDQKHAEKVKFGDHTDAVGMSEVDHRPWPRLIRPSPASRAGWPGEPGTASLWPGGHLTRRAGAGHDPSPVVALPGGKIPTLGLPPQSGEVVLRKLEEG